MWCEVCVKKRHLKFANFTGLYFPNFTLFSCHFTEFIMLIPTTDNGRHRVLLTPHPCKLPDTLYFRTFAIDIFQDFVFTYPRTAEYLFHYRLLNHVRIAKNQHLIIAFFLVTAISPIAIVVKKRSMKTFDGHFLSRSSPEKFEKPIVELILLFLFKIGQYKVLKCI